MNWQPIETAPRDRRILLFHPTLTYRRVMIGCWDEDKHSSRPRPYWTNDACAMRGITDTRKHPPTMWAEIEEPKLLDVAEIAEDETRQGCNLIQDYEAGR